jgi:hypothetical protein
MTTIYVRHINPDSQMARVTIARPRKTRRKRWLKFRKRHLIVSMKWLAERKPKGGVVRLSELP